MGGRSGILEHWSKARFRCILLGSELRPFRRPGRERQEVARTDRLRPGEMMLAISPSSLRLTRAGRDRLNIPIRNLSRVEIHPVSVDAQLIALLSGVFRSATWLGTAKGAILVLSAFFLIDDPHLQILRWLNHLPLLLAHVALSIPFGFLLHLPFRLLPGAWRIDGPAWRLRFEAMDGRAFNLLVGRHLRDTLIDLLRKTGLTVYLYPHRLTLLDRGWATRMRCEAAIRSFCREIF